MAVMGYLLVTNRVWAVPLFHYPKANMRAGVDKIFRDSLAADVGNVGSIDGSGIEFEAAEIVWEVYHPVFAHPV